MNKITIKHGELELSFPTTHLYKIDIIPDGVVFNFVGNDFIQINAPFLPNQSKEALMRLKNMKGNIMVNFDNPEFLVSLDLRK